MFFKSLLIMSFAMLSLACSRRIEMARLRQQHTKEFLKVDLTNVCAPAASEALEAFVKKAKGANRSLAIVDSLRWLEWLVEEKWALIVNSLSEPKNEKEYIFNVDSLQSACSVLGKNEDILVALGSQTEQQENDIKLYRVAKHKWCPRAFVVTDDPKASLSHVDAIIVREDIVTPFGKKHSLAKAWHDYQNLTHRLQVLIPMASSTAVDTLGPERVVQNTKRVDAFRTHLYEIDDGGDSGLDKRCAAGVELDEIQPDDYTFIPSWRRGSALRGGCDIWTRSATSSVRILLLHGGANTCYSPRAYRPLASRLAAATGFTVVVPDYRLAPEHVYPSALDDAEAVFNNHLAADPNVKHIILFGDSSGAALALSLAMFRLPPNHEKVRGLVTLSPWLDMSARTQAYEMKHDPVYNTGDAEAERRDTQNLARRYFSSSLSHFDPSVHPLYATQSYFTSLPPLYIIIGDAEVCRDDGLIFALRAQDYSKNIVNLDLWPKLWHVFVMYSEGMRLLKNNQQENTYLPFNEANLALRRICRWMHSLIRDVDEKEVTASPLYFIPIVSPNIKRDDIVEADDEDEIIPFVPLLDHDEPRPEDDNLYY